MTNIQRDVSEWTRSVFTTATPRSVINRIQEELDELKAEFDDKDGNLSICAIESEVADVMHCIIDFCALMNIDYERATYAKLIANKRRIWSQPDENNQRYHIKLNSLYNSHQWLAHMGLTESFIADPDGWNRTDLANSMNELIDFEEFRRRLFVSTTRIDPEKIRWIRSIGAPVTIGDLPSQVQE